MGTEMCVGVRMKERIAKFNTFLIFFLVYAERVCILLIIIHTIFNSKSPCNSLFSSLNSFNSINFPFKACCHSS